MLSLHLKHAQNTGTYSLYIDLPKFENTALNEKKSIKQYKKKKKSKNSECQDSKQNKKSKDEWTNRARKDMYVEEDRK